MKIVLPDQRFHDPCYDWVGKAEKLLSDAEILEDSRSGNDKGWAGIGEEEGVRIVYVKIVNIYL